MPQLIFYEQGSGHLVNEQCDRILVSKICMYVPAAAVLQNPTFCKQSVTNTIKWVVLYIHTLQGGDI
jgi:hypothetical protein